MIGWIWLLPSEEEEVVASRRARAWYFIVMMVLEAASRTACSSCQRYFDVMCKVLPWVGCVRLFAFGWSDGEFRKWQLHNFYVGINSDWTCFLCFLFFHPATTTTHDLPSLRCNWKWIVTSRTNTWRTRKRSWRANVAYSFRQFTCSGLIHSLPPLARTMTSIIDPYYRNEKDLWALAIGKSETRLVRFRNCLAPGWYNFTWLARKSYRLLPHTHDDGIASAVQVDIIEVHIKACARRSFLISRFKAELC